MKLLSSKQYLHGIEKQIIEYANAENCKKLIYFVFDDMARSEKRNERVDNIKRAVNSNIKNGYDVSLVIVKVEKKVSASLV